jgi:60 kDa SS-A/Ro ribonucleoprotein
MQSRAERKEREMNYLKQYSTKVTPQSEPIPGSDQVENSAGGYAYAVDKWTRLNRFLILGSESGSYYISQAKLTKENADTVVACVKEDGLRTVNVIVGISQDGRAPKNDPAIFALAICASLGDDATRKSALDHLPDVCRIGTHLFQFCTFVEQFRGWGRGLRKAVAAWYEDKDTDALAYQIVKYRQRDGWTHRDTFRLGHPVATKLDMGIQSALFKYVAKVVTHDELSGDAKEFLNFDKLPKIVEGFEKAQGATDAKETAKLVREYGLPREALQTEHLNSPEVWEAMLYEGGKYGMPITAMIRNLATMTRVGLLTPTSDATKKVKEMLNSQELLQHARVHPIAVLAAEITYGSGQSVRGSNTWGPIPSIVDALDEAFYLAFGNVEPTGKSRLLALDVSSSMTWGEVAGIPGFTPRVASAAMAMVAMRSGDPYECVAFTGGARFRSGGNPRDLTVLPLSPKQRLDDVLRTVENLPFGGTDCALPMVYAIQNDREVDAFEVFTDSETWTGNIHPSQALVDYRKRSGRDSKLIVYGMVSNGFSIADPNDPGMLDVVGFDTAVPAVVESFIKGSF